MQIITVDELHKPYTKFEQLEHPSIVGKYSCEFMIETPSGSKIYFTNIGCASDINDKNFVSVYVNRSQGVYVLAPDIIDSNRSSVLIVFNYNGQHLESIGSKQYMLYDFYEHDQDNHQIIGLGRECPELYDCSKQWASFYFSDGNEYMIRSDGTIAKQKVADTANIKSFIMYGRYCDDDWYLHPECKHAFSHPRTKFVVDQNNTIIMDPNIRNKDDMIQCIKEYLNNDNIPNGIAIVPVKNYIDWSHMEEVVKKNPPYQKYIIIGFDLEKTKRIRQICSR